MKEKLYVSLLCSTIGVGIITLGLYLSSRRILSFASMRQEEVTTELPSLLTDDGQPSPLLQDLLKELNVQHNDTLTDIVGKTQKAWLRPAGKERWHIVPSGKQYDEKKVKVLLRKLGYMERVLPCQDQYDYALIHGGSVTSLRTRLAYLINLYQQGTRFGKIIFLSGQRPLDPEQEGSAILLDKHNNVLPFKEGWNFDGVLPHNEYELARFVFEQAKIPVEMQKIEAIFVNAQGKTEADGTYHRPTTEDTIREWLTSNPLPGTCVAVSHQPYVSYQHSVLMTFLPDTFGLDTVGERSSETLGVEVYLDTVARHLYQEHKRLACLAQQN